MTKDGATGNKKARKSREIPHSALRNSALRDIPRSTRPEAFVLRRPVILAPSFQSPVFAEGFRGAHSASKRLRLPPKVLAGAETAML